MRIVHIIDHWGLGGAQRAVANIIAMDKRNSHSVISIYKHGRIDWGLSCPVTFLCNTYYSTLISFLRLRKYIQTLNPDILHIHLNGSRVVEYISTLGLKQKPAIIWHEHSGEEPMHTYGPILGRFLTWFFRRIKKRVYFISNSTNTTQYLQTELKVPEDQIEKILCPINIENLSQAPETIQHLPENCHLDQKPILGFVGRLSPQKGVRQLCDIVTPIFRKFPESQLWVIGDGPHKKELKKKFQHAGFESRCFFWGTRKDVFTLIKNLDVVLMPSQYEPYGLVAMEALLLRKPVIGYRVGGLADILKEHPLGFPVDLNQTNSFSQTVIQALNTNKEHGNISNQQFDTTPMISELYKTLVSNQP